MKQRKIIFRHLSLALFAICFIATSIASLGCHIMPEDKSASRIVAELAIDTKSGQISPEAYERAKMTVLDILGNAMAGIDAPGIPEIREQFQEWGGTPQSSVWFTETWLPLPSAGFVNSSAAHAMDLDDWHKPSNTHISVVTVPAALAVAEMTGASGQEVIEAIVIGVEVANSIGEAYVKHRQHNSFLPTSIVGGFGATAIACRLMDLSVEQTIHAFGIFYSHASGNRQALFDRTLTKRIQPAIAVKAALVSASLAAKGFTGPENVFISKAGLLSIYGGDQDQLPEANSFRKKEASWAIEKVAFKKYACCGASHPAIEAAIELSKKHKLNLAEITSIELFGIWVGTGMVDIPWTDSDNPQVLAQFCAPYEVVSAIKYGSFGPAQISESQIAADHDVDEFARKVLIRHEDEWGEGYPGGQTVRIETTDGRILVSSRTPAEIFDPGDWSAGDVAKKFITNAVYSGLVSEKEAMKMAEAVMKLETMDNILPLLKAQEVGPEIIANWKITRPGPPHKLGVTVSKPAKYYEGYTFFISWPEEAARLIDMEGRQVHSWKRELGSWWHFAEMLPNGNILVVANNRGYNAERNGIQRVFELNWESNLVWECFVPGHHDAERLENGNTLVVCNGNAVYPEINKEPCVYDYLQELNSKGEAIWEWHYVPHHDQVVKLCGDLPLTSPSQDYPHINTIEALPDNPLAEKDKRFTKGNILISARDNSVVFIIEKSTGDIVWAWGPGEILGQHEPTMLENGNILIFDNGKGQLDIPDRSYTRVIELDPVSKQIVWEYRADPPEEFVSYVGSGNQRLGNGNTLICAMNWQGRIGRIFEVTQEKEIVWEYWNTSQEKIYRAYRYPEEWVNSLIEINRR